MTRNLSDEAYAKYVEATGALVQTLPTIEEIKLAQKCAKEVVDTLTGEECRWAMEDLVRVGVITRIMGVR